MQVVEAVHQRQVLVATDHLMEVLVVTAVVVKAIKQAATLGFHLRPAQQTQAVAVVTAAQAVRAL
jgi:hypothetical protein